MINIKNVLYPTDFSSYSNQAYFHAVALAENHGAQLTILYVYSSGFGGGTVSSRLGTPSVPYDSPKRGRLKGTWPLL